MVYRQNTRGPPPFSVLGAKKCGQKEKGSWRGQAGWNEMDTNFEGAADWFRRYQPV